MNVGYLLKLFDTKNENLNLHDMKSFLNKDMEDGIHKHREVSTESITERAPIGQTK